MGSVQNPYVISRCGIFNGQSSDLPHYPHTKLTTHTPSLISLLLFLSLPVSCMHLFMHLHSLASNLCRTQTRCACVAGANCPAGLLLHRWNRLSCLSLHFSFFQSVPSVRLCCALLSQSSRLVISIVRQYWVFVVSSSSLPAATHIKNRCIHTKTAILNRNLRIFLVAFRTHIHDCYFHLVQPTQMAAAGICFCF